MCCVQLSEGVFQVVYPLGLWSRSSGVVKVPYVHIRIWLAKCLHLRLHLLRMRLHVQLNRSHRIRAANLACS